jgi:hypothetical protein
MGQYSNKQACFDTWDTCETEKYMNTTLFLHGFQLYLNLALKFNQFHKALITTIPKSKHDS